jgi:hypothetical protein
MFQETTLEKVNKPVTFQARSTGSITTNFGMVMFSPTNQFYRVSCRRLQGFTSGRLTRVHFGLFNRDSKLSLKLCCHYCTARDLVCRKFQQ